MARVMLTVNGEPVRLNDQMQKVFAEVVAGLVRTLHGVDGEARTVSLECEF